MSSNEPAPRGMHPEAIARMRERDPVGNADVPDEVIAEWPQTAWLSFALFLRDLGRALMPKWLRP